MLNLLHKHDNARMISTCAVGSLALYIRESDNQISLHFIGNDSAIIFDNIHSINIDIPTCILIVNSNNSIQLFHLPDSSDQENDINSFIERIPRGLVNKKCSNHVVLLPSETEMEKVGWSILEKMANVKRAYFNAAKWFIGAKSNDASPEKRSVSPGVGIMKNPWIRERVIEWKPSRRIKNLKITNASTNLEPMDILIYGLDDEIRIEAWLNLLKLDKSANFKIPISKDGSINGNDYSIISKQHKEQIEKDVPRTDINVELRSILRSLLLYFVQNNPDIGYVQGMNEIASVCILTSQEYAALIFMKIMSIYVCHYRIHSFIHSYHSTTCSSFIYRLLFLIAMARQCILQ